MSEQPVTRDVPVTAQGPIPLFNAKLQILTDSYLSFYTERRRIEETYVESLSRLLRKMRSIDSFLDDRGESSSARKAWSEIRDNFDREIQARQAFLSTLGIDVITPLTTFKDTQDRTRKRIKEDLKESFNAYDDYKEVTLPKLKIRYLRKYQEVEEQKRAAAAPMSPGMPPLGSDNTGLSHSKTMASTRPTPTSPQPLRALDRRPSGSSPGGRNRSPSGSTPFSDLAHQGRRQFTQLIDSLGGNKENQALRNVRTKREADDADKEYRNGVHFLETLRLRRIKTLESGYKSLEMYVEEESTLIKRVLEKYADNMMATSAHQTQLANNVRVAVDKISPERDLVNTSANFPRSLASAVPERILYQHGQVGPCKDLLFGFSLVDYATTKNLPDGHAPKIIRLCINEIDHRGLEAEGIYRVSGRLANVQMLQREIEKDENKFEFKPQRDDVFVVGSLLKLYLRELPEPVFRFSLQDRIQHSADLEEHLSNNLALLRSKIRRLPAVHQATLRALIGHLSRVVARSDKNKMDPKNLAIVFGTVIFGEDEMPQGGDLLTVQNSKDTMMEDLITHGYLLYDDQPAHHSPPLPPTPAGPVPAISYGSKNTKVVTVPPSSPAPQGQLHDTRESTPDDFTPRLPPRPLNSIHPSSRAGAASPTKDRTLDPPPLPQRRPAQSQVTEAPSTPPPELAEPDVPNPSPSKSSTHEAVSPTSPRILTPVREASETPRTEE